MDYQERLLDVSVLGAAGKMGSGIVLLMALELCRLQLRPENRGRKFVLNAIDLSSKALSDLRTYLRTQVLKEAEKRIVELRGAYAERADLVENREIIQQFVTDVSDVVRFSPGREPAYQSSLILEAVNEEAALKVNLFQSIEDHNRKKPWYFTNTSSIPVGELNEQAKLGGRIIGFHFYNPPAVQKLVEVIAANETRTDLETFAISLAENLRKISVRVNDFAGFVGNGHFIRELAHAVPEAEELQRKGISLPEALYSLDRVTRDFLIRPMGIFQLVDYVGLDICVSIMKVMQAHFPGEKLRSPLLETLLSAGVMGGQNPDGSQRNGIFQYERSRIAGVYDLSAKAYRGISEIAPAADGRLGALPATHRPWQQARGLTERDSFFRRYFQELRAAASEGAELARRYAAESKRIGLALVSGKIAASEQDVNEVMMNGFYHAYGPINDFLN